MSTRVEVHMSLQDEDGHCIVKNRVMRPEQVVEFVSSIVEGAENYKITLDVHSFHDEPFRRIDHGRFSQSPDAPAG